MHGASGALVSVRDPRLSPAPGHCQASWLLPSSVAACDSHPQDSRLKAAAFPLRRRGVPGCPAHATGRRRRKGQGQTLTSLSSAGLPQTHLCGFQQCGHPSALIETYFPKALLINRISNVCRFELARRVALSHRRTPVGHQPWATPAISWQGQDLCFEGEQGFALGYRAGSCPRLGSGRRRSVFGLS